MSSVWDGTFRFTRNGALSGFVPTRFNLTKLRQTRSAHARREPDPGGIYAVPRSHVALSPPAHEGVWDNHDLPDELGEDPHSPSSQQAKGPPATPLIPLPHN
ncbi:hypothetical protein ARTHRO9V_160092 [Arthrobacter sp. 9V]|nr:hypothetical protein ARTHRO9V_160092 [Arthrobacter sp. 9V]